MTWTRSKKTYEICYLGPVRNDDGSPVAPPGIAIQGLWYGPDSFFDWQSRGFQQGQPARAVQPLSLRPTPAFPGNVQRWGYSLSTADFPDGEFMIYLVGADGGLAEAPPTFFSVYQHSAIGIVPAPVPGTDA